MDAVKDCALRVMSALGTGRRESVYQAALRVELQIIGQFLDAEVSHPITYRGHHVGIQRLDLEGPEYFIELKASTRILPAHIAQAAAYARDRLKPGIVINFGPHFGIQYVDCGVDMQPVDLQKIMTTTFTMTSNNLLDVPLTPEIVQVRYGEDVRYIPKLMLKVGDKSYPAFRTAPALAVKFSTLGENGDQEQFNKSEQEARFSFVLRQKVPTRVEKVLPTLKNEQDKAFEILDGDHERLVLAAFDSDDVQCAHKTKALKAAKKKLGKTADPKEIRALARTIYLENSSNCMIKTREFQENGEDVETKVLVTKRRIVGMRNGEKQRLNPVFHKINCEGDYKEVTYDEYVPQDTLLKVRVRPQFFSAPLMYGTSCWFDKDIIVLWRPKKAEAKVETALVPVFEDGDDEVAPSNKRARDDEDAQPAKRSRND